MVIPFIINIAMEINFSSKVYSKSLLKGSPLSCTSLEEVVSCPVVWRPIFCKSKENQYLVQKYGGQYFEKVLFINLFYFIVPIGITACSIIMDVALVIKTAE